MVIGSSGLLNASGADDPSVVGQFAAPFEEAGPLCTTDANGVNTCKPAGASVVTLPSGQILYWNALEGTENIAHAAVPEGAAATVDDSNRVHAIRGAPACSKP